ncbi:MAG: sensor histidine kinase [Candidatus Kapabacteria bacterium]|nr:sensor histidine kinase [Candidatus Kapabacteria bacterium]
MASEHSNSLVELHSKLDQLIQEIALSSDFTVSSMVLREDFVNDIEDTDILLSLKKHFLLGHICLQKKQIPEGIVHFQQSIRLQEELSYEDIKVVTLTSLFECFRITNSALQTYEFAFLLENEQNIPEQIRKNILLTLILGYSYVGFSKKAIETLHLYLKETLTTKENALAQKSLLQLQFQQESSIQKRTIAFDSFEKLLKEIEYDIEVATSYLDIVLSAKEFDRLGKMASLLKEFHSNKQQPFGRFWYFEVVSDLRSKQRKITDVERKNIAELCIREKQYLYAIMVNVLFVSESDNACENSVEILESTVNLFDESIPNTTQIEVLERIVECCEKNNEWKKGLYYFELYHNALQTIANENNEKTIETIQLKQYISSLNKNSHIPSVSSEILQRRNQARQLQQIEYEQFQHSLRTYVKQGVIPPLELLLELPTMQYSSLFAESTIFATQMMISTFETIIELHSLEDGTYSSSQETIPLITITEKLQSQLKFLATRYECSIEMYIDRKIHWYGDVRLLSKSLFHILQNACKFSLKHSTIVLKASVQNNEMEISITDSGVGVKDEHIGLVFSKYFQYDPLSTSSQSAGLGLPYCKKAISFMHGNIQITSKVDIGTEVKIIFPFSVNSSIPVPITPTISISPFTTELTKADIERLTTALTLRTETNSYQQIISTIDTIEGSQELREWKQKLYVSMLYGETSIVNSMLAQIH